MRARADRRSRSARRRSRLSPAGGRSPLAGVDRAEDVLADPGHAALVDEAAAALGQTLAVLVNALDPSLIVLAGGLGGVPAFRTRVADVVLALLAYPAEPALELIGSALGADGGIVGAALATAGRAAR